jgi:hypothetical protein
MREVAQSSRGARSLAAAAAVVVVAVAVVVVVVVAAVVASCRVSHDLLRAPLVDLHALAPDPQPDAGDVVVRLRPVERPLDDFADGVDPVKRHREEARREKRDVLITHREYERRAVREQKRHERANLDVLERYRRRHDALARFQGRHHELALAVQVERAAFADVPQPTVVLDDGLYPRHDHVRAVLKRHLAVLVRLARAFEQRPERRRAVSVFHEQLLIPRLGIVRVP